jgi:hypothetical protein
MHTNGASGSLASLTSAELAVFQIKTGFIKAK